MQSIHQPLVIGNWKMNPLTAREAKNIISAYKTVAKKYTSVAVVAAVPHIYIAECSKASIRGLVALGVQNMHHEPSGAYTGEISAPMCLEYGVSHVILGHSERRKAGETDIQVSEKVSAAIKNRVTPIVCVGESERDVQAAFYPYVAAQVLSALSKLPKARVKDVVIAYEPVWAIGTGVTPTLDEVREMRLFIYKILAETYGLAAAKSTRVIYGGSVNPGNAKILFTETQMNGFLVGGASLRAADFSQIVAAVAK